MAKKTIGSAIRALKISEPFNLRRQEVSLSSSENEQAQIEVSNCDPSQGNSTQGDLPQVQEPQGNLTQGEQTQGDCTQGNPTQGNAPHDEQGELTHGEITQGNSTQVGSPQGSFAQGDCTQGNSTRVNLPQGEQPQGNSTSEVKSEFANVERQLADRKQRRRESAIQNALTAEYWLNSDLQEQLVKQHLAGGWGRLAHCLLRALKAPKRYGLKLVDVVLILTVYDRTIAQVVPQMFAPITTEEFEEETGMDESNIRKALGRLVKIGALDKITYKNVNFWGLNHGYFAPDKPGGTRHKQGNLTQGSSTQVDSPQGNLTHGNSTQGNLPQGNSTWVNLPQGSLTQGEIPQGEITQGNAPCDKKGELPQVDEVIYPPRTASSDRNDLEKCVSKNLKKESKKESLSCTIEFPEDMKARWSNFAQTGKFGNVTKEKEIFEELFIDHGEDVLSHCGRVVQFLEEHGNGKSGDEGKVYNPMAYLRGHWEHNFNRYRAWLTRQEELKAAKERQAVLEQIRRQEQAAKAGTEGTQSGPSNDEAVLLLHQAYPLDNEFNSLVENIVSKSQCVFTKNSWKKFGLGSYLVRVAVGEYFRGNERVGQPTSHLAVQAIA